MKPEEWRDVVGYEGIYQVSDAGGVRVLDRLVEYGDGVRGARLKRGHDLKPQVMKKGHLVVQLYRDGTQKGCLIHRLVLEAFVGPCPDGMEGCHNDGNPANNNLDNLRWDTSKANNLDKTRHGTQNTGSKHGMSVLVEAQVAEIKRRLKLGDSQRSIAKDYGVSQMTISKINRGLLWSHVEV